MEENSRTPGASKSKSRSKEQDSSAFHGRPVAENTGKSKLLDTILKEDVVQIPGVPDDKPSTFIQDRGDEQAESEAGTSFQHQAKGDIGEMVAQDWFSRVRVLPGEQMSLPHVKSFGPVNCVHLQKFPHELVLFGDSDQKLHVELGHGHDCKYESAPCWRKIGRASCRE